MMSPLLLALAEEEEVPNYAAVQLSPVVGWLFFAALLGLVAFFLAHRESWRRLFLRLDDPRPMAAMRIVFGLCAISNINELSDQFIYLFTDEGIFPTDVAQHFRARQQFAGFGDGTAETEPWGFFGFQAFVEWLKGPNWSLLLFDSSPRTFWIYLGVLEVAMFMFIVGFQTKWIKWVAWFLYMGLILRNTLFWEATENVYRVFFFYLLLSRCGEAWSVDNWLRCRRLRKQGKLSEPGKPGEGAGDAKAGLEPIYRAIPAWPRMLVILNVAMIYCATGTLKNGPIWMSGDAFYYSFNLDHFYRLPPQALSSVFGTTLFKVNTHVTHFWEMLFPVVVFSMIVRWYRREKPPALTGAALWQARLGLLTFCTAFYALVLYSYPVHYEALPEGLSILNIVHFPQEVAMSAVIWIVAISVPLVSTGMFLGYRWLRDRPPRAQRRHLAWLDLDWFLRWPLGRRIWLVLGLIFHGHLILTMNIGWFSPGLLACYFAFMNGGELSHVLVGIGRKANQWLRIPMPANVRQGVPIPVADPAVSGKRDRFRLGYPELLTAAALIVVGVIRRVQSDPDMWEEIGKVVGKAKIDIPAGVLDQGRVIEANWFVAMVLVMALVVIVRRVRGYAFNPWFGPVIVLTGWLGSELAQRGNSAMIWWVFAVGVLSWLATRKRAEPEQSSRPPAAEKPTEKPSEQSWAYGPIWRTLATILLIYQIVAAASTAIPDKDSWSTFHRGIDDTFKLWLSTTQTSQGWGMFAPNPPRRNVFMRVMVTDIDGEVYDLNTDVYACFMPEADQATCDAVYPMPWIWYSRRGKMNRRIVGSEGGAGGWYQKWHARYICRQWQLEHGHLPDKVELYKVSYPIPSPEQVKGKPYDPKTQYNRRGSSTKLHTTECSGSPLGQMSDEVRERHGLGPAPEGEEFVEWNKNRCRSWEQKLIDDARKERGEVDITDPEFDVCPDTPPSVRRKLDEQKRDDNEETIEDAPLGD